MCNVLVPVPVPVPVLGKCATRPGNGRRNGSTRAREPVLRKAWRRAGRVYEQRASKTRPGSSSYCTSDIDNHRIKTTTQRPSTSQEALQPASAEYPYTYRGVGRTLLPCRPAIPRMSGVVGLHKKAGTPVTTTRRRLQTPLLYGASDNYAPISRVRVRFPCID